MLKQLLTTLLLICSLSTTAIGVAQANDSGAVTLKQAIIKALENAEGDVIKTEAAEYKGKAVYKIRLVNEGRVKDIMIDSQSGEIIKP